MTQEILLDMSPGLVANYFASGDLWTASAGARHYH